MGKVILCPYCCKRFQPNRVDFRLVRPITESGEETDHSEEVQLPGMGIPNMVKNKPRTKESSDSKIHDEKLYRYYIDFLNINESDARNDAYLMPAISPDYQSPDLVYDEVSMGRYGYVTEANYKGQVLNKRLCPHCHNPIIDGAGKYDMFLISVIGDTNVGKTVYLTVLQEMLKRDQFKGTMQFMGTKLEKELCFGNIDKLIHEKKVLDASARQKIPPMPFRYTFETADNREAKSCIIIFCDIAGEDCRNAETMEKNGYHIKASSGLLIMIDPTRFNTIKYNTEDGMKIENRYQLEVITAIYRFLIANTFEEQTKIPTAIILTKGDVLREMDYFKGEIENGILAMNNADLHPGYLNLEETKRLDEVLEQFLKNIGESEFCHNRRLFNTSSFFVCSSLGKNPEQVDRINYDNMDTFIGINGTIKPYRVAEPFYWLLMQNNIIPCKYTERLIDYKGQERVIELYYYANESKGSLQNRIDALKKSILGHNRILPNLISKLSQIIKRK